MKVWTNTKFEGHNPVGVAAVVVADTPELAAYILNQKLLAYGLEQTAKAEDMDWLPTDHEQAVVLNDGHY